jgi:type I restriction enzyme S subunit
MPNQPVETLRGKVNVLSGFAFPSAGFKQAEGMPLIRIRDLDGSSTEVRFQGKYDSTYIVRTGDVLIGMDGDFEVRRWSGDAALLNQRVCKVTATGSALDSGFLYWYLKPQIAAIHRKTPQTTVRHLSSVNILDIPAPLFPLAEQRTIALLLDLIESNIRTAQTSFCKLKQVKQGLLHDLLTRGIDSNGELRPTRSSRPQLYRSYEFGWIPKTWALKSVGSEFEIKLGKMLDEEKNFGLPKPYLGNSAVQWDGIRVENLPLMKMSGQDLDRFILKKGDLLVCEGGEVGRAAIWKGEIEECYYQKALHRLRPKSSYVPYLMLSLLRLWTSGGLLANYVSQTSIAHLTREKLATVPLPVPPPEEQLEICSRLASLESRIVVENVMLNKLRLTQAGLTDDLLTGRVRMTSLLEK